MAGDGSPRYEEALKVAANRHDLSVVQVYDPRERSIPDIGLVNVKDSETSETLWGQYLGQEGPGGV